MTRCGLLASSGLPVRVSLPETVQLLLPSAGGLGNSIRESLPTRFCSKAGENPDKSVPGAGSNFTGGSKSKSSEAESAPTAFTARACSISPNALPVIENAAMRFRQSAGFQNSGLNPAS
jgi:hypothetical protein